MDLADLIGDSDSPKKEKMANAKILDQHFAKKKVTRGLRMVLSTADGKICSSFVVVMPFRWRIMQSTRLLDRLMKRLVAKIFKHFVREWKNSKTFVLGYLTFS